MSDTYQAVYDAVRSRITGFDGYQLALEIAEKFDISHAVEMVKYSYQCAAAAQERPSVLYRPSLSFQGDQWCALYGEDIQSGVAGFGDTPSEAMAAFDDTWHSSVKPSTVGIFGVSAEDMTSKLTIKEKQ